MTYTSIAEIYAAIDEMRGRIVKTVESLTDEQICYRPSETGWSVANTVEHLALTEANLTRVVLKLLAKAEAENVPAPVGGVIDPPVSFAEYAPKFAAMKLEAPDYIRPTCLASLSQSLAELQNTRAALHDLRPRLEAVDLSNVKFPHPFIGELNLYQWLAFIGIHEGRHYRQIVNTLAAQKAAV